MLGDKKKKDAVISPNGESVSEKLKHIAFIMDGNGRWAQKRLMPREAGHKTGAKVFDRIACHCFEIGIPTVTVYAFSTENWSRPQKEVDAIMALFSKYIDSAKKRFEKHNVSIRFLGDRNRLSDALREKMTDIERESAGRPRTLNIALNYGARDELVHAFRALVAEGKTDITAKDISDHLYTAPLPDPDLIVRTGGDFRISNFLLWQAAYAEFYFTPTLWPDLTDEEVDNAVRDFLNRHRRFGGV